MKSPLKKNEWKEAAKLLGLELTNANSTQAQCPFCTDGKLKIFADTLIGGLRFKGHHCFPHGDLLDLVAKKQDCNRAAAMRWLEQAAPSLHKTYTSHLLERQLMLEGQQRIDEIWQAGMPLKDAYFQEGFQRILKNRGMPFDQRLSWHTQNLDMQFRAITSEALETALGVAGKATYREQASKRFHCPKGFFIIARLYSLPGQVVGLHLLTTGSNNRAMEYFEPFGGVGEEAGLLVHPERICDGETLIATSSQWAVKAGFVHANQSSSLNPFVGFIDHGRFRTRSLQPLFFQPVIFWCPRLTPHVLHAAVRLNARITHFGVRSEGTIRTESLRQLMFDRVIEAMGRQSVSWQEAVIAYGRQHSAGDLLELLRNADLPAAAVEVIADTLRAGREKLHS